MSELRVDRLSVRSGERVLVHDVSLTVRTGEVVALVGPSGSGKTLTLRGTLDVLPFRPGRVGGEVYIDAKSQGGRALRAAVGLLFQEARASLDPLRTLGAQLVHAARLAGAEADVHALLRQRGFADPAFAATRFPHELSGGMAQRAATAVALARRCAFLFCDEPTTGLDAPVQAELIAELRRIEGVGILFVTHDLRLLPGFADRILVMDDGRIVEEADRVEGLSGAGRRLVEATRGIAAPGWGGPGTDAATQVPTAAGGASIVTDTSKVLLDLQDLRVVHRRAWSLQPPVVAVNAVTLQVRGGEIVGLIGESGCGKTSLIRAASGLLRRDGGRVSCLGVDPAIAARPPPRVQLLVQDAGAALNPELSVEAWLAESARVHRPGSTDAARQALTQAGLGHRASALPAALSGGEQRRLTLAALSLADPLLTFADEPTAGLDAARKAELLDALIARHGPDRALVLITHDVNLARHICTRLVFLHDGRVVDDVSTSNLDDARSAPARRLLAAAGIATGNDT
ncbi:ABC transporter ATP-binding protein [Deltaproteobacteria bacterium]|nr:ABC transporter ATP-binding protein [Deltaproteobacteria bacterium]